QFITVCGDNALTAVGLLDVLRERVIGGVKHLFNGVYDLSSATGFIQPRLTRLLQEGVGGYSKGITRQKDHPRAQRGIIMLEKRIEGLSIDLRHHDVTENHVKVLGGEEFPCTCAIARCHDRVASMLEKC